MSVKADVSRYPVSLGEGEGRGGTDGEGNDREEGRIGRQEEGQKKMGEWRR